MILKGSQRGGALKLAGHLLRLDENDHVEVHELRGFAANDLREGLREAEAVAKGTKCRQHLFSLSFNPPETERVGIEAFEAAIDEAEKRLGLVDQARAIVFHEKEGRRHAHVVWSRINVETMTAVHLPFYKMKLNALARELYLEHGWRLPEGLRDRRNRDPLNFSQAEWQQAKRAKQDAKELKLTFQECWAVSDNRAAFEQALAAKGFLLARGDRRGFVAIDYRGEVYSLSRWTGTPAKTLKDKLGDPDRLDDDADTKKAKIAARMTEKLGAFIQATETEATRKSTGLLAQKAELRTGQRSARHELRTRQEERSTREAVERAARFRSGLLGVWDWVSGRTRKIRKQNEAEVTSAANRDRNEQATLISAQLSERRLVQRDLRDATRDASRTLAGLREDVAFYLGWREGGAIVRGAPLARERTPKLHRTPEV